MYNSDEILSTILQRKNNKVDRIVTTYMQEIVSHKPGLYNVFNGRNSNSKRVLVFICFAYVMVSKKLTAISPYHKILATLNEIFLGV